MITEETVFEDGIHKWAGSFRGTVNWSLFCGDAKLSLGHIPEESVNCIITSPPYYCLRDYNMTGQIGLEDTVEEYVNALVNVMDEAYRVLRKDGLLFLNLGDTYYSGKGKSHGRDVKSSKRRFGLRPVDKKGGLGLDIPKKSIIGVPWRVAIAMMSKRWVLRTPIIWHRDKALPESVVDRPRRSYEYIFMFAKDRHYFFNRQPLIDKAFDEDVWTILARPKVTNGINTAPYPDNLVERCLEIGCPNNGLVLDPFVGSGTTLRVAVMSGRSGIGIDLSPDFCNYVLRDMEKNDVPLV